jgi:flagella basal body P-ring formation protein FlgA
MNKKGCKFVKFLQRGGEDKAFFFEKKKQKTFTRCRGPMINAPKEAKVFWFPPGGIRLFSKKNILSSMLPAQLPASPPSPAAILC